MNNMNTLYEEQCGDGIMTISVDGTGNVHTDVCREIIFPSSGRKIRLGGLEFEELREYIDKLTLREYVRDRFIGMVQYQNVPQELPNDEQAIDYVVDDIYALWLCRTGWDVINAGIHTSLFEYVERCL